MTSTLGSKVGLGPPLQTWPSMLRAGPVCALRRPRGRLPSCSMVGMWQPLLLALALRVQSRSYSVGMLADLSFEKLAAWKTRLAAFTLLLLPPMRTSHHLRTRRHSCDQVVPRQVWLNFLLVISDVLMIFRPGLCEIMWRFTRIASQRTPVSSSPATTMSSSSG